MPVQSCPAPWVAQPPQEVSSREVSKHSYSLENAEMGQATSDPGQALRFALTARAKRPCPACWLAPAEAVVVVGVEVDVVVEPPLRGQLVIDPTPDWQDEYFGLHEFPADWSAAVEPLYASIAEYMEPKAEPQLLR